MTKTRASRVTACLINYKIDCITTEGEDSTFRRSKGNSFQLFVAKNLHRQSKEYFPRR